MLSTSTRSSLLVLLLLISALRPHEGFIISPFHSRMPAPRVSSSPLRPLHGFFDKAFANEDMGKRENAGLKNGPKVNDQVTINGEKKRKRRVDDTGRKEP